MMPSVYRELFELAGRDPEDYIPMQKLDPMYEVYFKGSPYRHYTISSDLVELMKLTEAKARKMQKDF
jgi:phytoene desaturase